MALVSCSECLKEISNQADVCPNCGAPTSKKRNQKPSQAWGVAAIGFALGAAFTPYFASVFFTPIALVLGLVALAKRQKLAGVVALVLALGAAEGIRETSNKIEAAQINAERSVRQLQDIGKQFQQQQ